MNYNPLLSALTFIQAYREIEKSTIKAGEGIIRQVFTGQVNSGHLCSSWRGRKRDWGDFYLNLSRSSQYLFLKFCGLEHPAGDGYLEKVEADSIATLFIDPPECIEWPHELLKFFYNHGIDTNPASGITLTTLPAGKQRYGNSCNWGNYILSLPASEQQRVLSEILTYTRTRH